MRIFVTGANGILGRYVCKWLRVYRPKVHIIKNTADITDINEVQETVEKNYPLDMVIHLAAIVPVSKVQAKPELAYRVNVGGTINLLEAIIQKKPKFVYCSSAHVYDYSEYPILEESPMAPQSIYGRTKMIAEMAATDIAKSFDIPLSIPRVFSIHDPAQTGTYLRPTLEKRLSTEDLSQPFKLIGAKSIRDILTAEEAARRLVIVSLSSYLGKVNIGSGHGTKIEDFVQSLSYIDLDIEPVGQGNQLVANIDRLIEIAGVALFETKENI
ncbi:MAG: NAD(P)-dependent oxidoreductase [Ekhidna sp.]|nr:NAD(P)-dependent oxidoreductase [Ekhidna sp.]